MSKLAGYTPYEAVISEMAGVQDVSEFVTVDPDLLAGIVDPEDKSPMFVTIEVISEAVSKNGVSYTPEMLHSIAEQINSKRVDGYRGHLKDDERATKTPEPQTIWLGAAVKEVQGKLRLFAKGYVLPYAGSLRSYLRAAKAAGKNVAVSIYGLTTKWTRDANNHVVPAVFSLESIDWARSGSAGVPNVGLFAVTAEMTDDSKEGDAMERLEVLKTAKASELKELNPMVIAEIADETRTAVEAEQAQVIAEMTEIKELVEVPDGKTTAQVIKEMSDGLAELGDLRLDNELREKVAIPAARKVIRRMVIAEMTDDAEVSTVMDQVLASEEGQAVIREMVQAEPKIAPKVVEPAASARKYTKQ